jgi:hypothetical protein
MWRLTRITHTMKYSSEVPELTYCIRLIKHAWCPFIRTVRFVKLHRLTRETSFGLALWFLVLILALVSCLSWSLSLVIWFPTVVITLAMVGVLVLALGPCVGSWPVLNASMQLGGSVHWQSQRPGP